MFKKMLDFSRLLWGVNRIISNLFFRGGNKNNACLSGETFFKLIIDTAYSNSITKKPWIVTNGELQKLLFTKVKLIKEQKLLKSIFEEAPWSKAISDKGFENVQEMYEFRRKYKNYVRLKWFVPLTLIALFTTTELFKMSYPATLGSRSVSLTLPGLIWYSLSTFYFFHMSSFYLPDKVTPICQFYKYTLGAPFWIMVTVTNELISSSEEMYFGEKVSMVILGNGCTIPGDLEDVNKLCELLDYRKDFS